MAEVTGWPLRPYVFFLAAFLIGLLLCSPANAQSTNGANMRQTLPNTEIDLLLLQDLAVRLPPGSRVPNIPQLNSDWFASIGYVRENDSEGGGLDAKTFNLLARISDQCKGAAWLGFTGPCSLSVRSSFVDSLTVPAAPAASGVGDFWFTLLYGAGFFEDDDAALDGKNKIEYQKWCLCDTVGVSFKPSNSNSVGTDYYSFALNFGRHGAITKNVSISGKVSEIFNTTQKDNQGHGITVENVDIGFPVEERERWSLRIGEMGILPSAGPADISFSIGAQYRKPNCFVADLTFSEGFTTDLHHRQLQFSIGFPLGDGFEKYRSNCSQ